MTLSLVGFARHWRLASVALLVGLGGCSPDSLIGDGELPPDAQDPAETRTAAGAMSAYRGTQVLFREAVGGGEQSSSYSFVFLTGLLSDEIVLAGQGFGSDILGYTTLDTRSLPELAVPNPSVTGTQAYAELYRNLHRIRGQAQQSRGLLERYAADSSPDLRSHLLALEGYADIYLADGFCSGVPLSTVDYGGDYTLRPGSTRDQVYTRARELFDSALALSGDSVRITNLARMGRARALLALGQYALAGQEASLVEASFSYQLQYADLPGANFGFAASWNFARSLQEASFFSSSPTMADREGQNGLDYRSSADPRTAFYEIPSNSPFPGAASYLPVKYPVTGDTPVIVASGIEARLIEAEAALQGGDPATWLGLLNTLRQSAIAPALADTTDPVDAAARVNLMFRERAFWLFLEGHRQGDLRRLVRQYGRNPLVVYPTGARPSGGIYGNELTIPVPASERVGNQFFRGCLDRGA